MNPEFFSNRLVIGARSAPRQDAVFLHGKFYFNRAATDFTVFNILLLFQAQVKKHRNIFSAIGARKYLFNFFWHGILSRDAQAGLLAVKGFDFINDPADIFFIHIIIQGKADNALAHFVCLSH